MAAWELVLDDREGSAVAFLAEATFSLTRRINGGGELELELATGSDGARALTSPGARRLRAYRDGVLRFHGDIDEPLVSTHERVKAIARDPWAELVRTPIAGDIESFSATDAGAIAIALLETAPAAIKAGTVAPSIPRDRIYEIGKRLGEAIAQLAEVDDGFWFLVQPIEFAELSARPAIGELEIRYPLAGVDRPAARFEFGESTIANLAEFTEELRLPRNYVLALGAVIPPTPHKHRYRIGSEFGGLTGNYAIAILGQQTAPLAHDASPSTVQAALEALPNINPGDVTASEGTMSDFSNAVTEEKVDLTWQGQYEGVNVGGFSIVNLSLDDSGGLGFVTWATQNFQLGNPGTSGKPLQAEAEDLASQEEHGFRPEALAWADVLDPVTLAQHAQGAIIPEPIAVYTVKGSAEAPALFDEFDVGDRVPLRLLEGRVDVEALVRVMEATLTVSSSGEEKISSMVLASELVRRAAPPSRRVFDLLERTDSRLRALEGRSL